MFSESTPRPRRAAPNRHRELEDESAVRCLAPWTMNRRPRRTVKAAERAPGAGCGGIGSPAQEGALDEPDLARPRGSGPSNALPAPRR